MDLIPVEGLARNIPKLGGKNFSPDQSKRDDTPSKIQRANFLMAKLLQGLDTSSLQKWGNFDRNLEPSVYWGKVLGQPYNEKVSIKRDPWIRDSSHTPSVNNQMTKEPNDMTWRWALVH